MKRSERKKIALALCGAHPELSSGDRSLSMSPPGSILRRVYLENSSDASSIYVWHFVQPLYVPSEHVVFNLGERLRIGGMERWGLHNVEDLVALSRIELPRFFAGTSTPDALLNRGFFDGRPD